MDVSKLSTNNWIAAGGGLLALVSGFLPWFKYGDASIGAAFNIDTETSQSGFDAGFFAVLGILLAIAAATILLLKVLEVKDISASNLSAEQIAMVLGAVATIFILLRVLLAPDFSSGRSFGGFIGLLSAAATAVGAFLSGQDVGVGLPTADDFGVGGGGGDATPPSTF